MAAALSRLIADGDARLAALDAEDGALRAARSVHMRSLEVRRELDDLQVIRHRLLRRFVNAGAPLAAVPSG